MKKIKKAIIAVLVCIMCISGTIIVRRTLELKKESAQLSEIQKKMTETDPTVIEPLKTETITETDTEPDNTASTYEAPEGLIELISMYPECIGYIDIEGSNVHYPIMQNADNEYYLHRDINGEESLSGSIYMDSNHDISEKGLHVIYGHHMKDGSMFKDVARYVNPKYMEDHQKITIKTAYKEMRLKPVYCYAGKADGTYRSIITSHGQVINFIKEHTGEEIDADDLYVLITCSYGSSDERTYLYCIAE